MKVQETGFILYKKERWETQGKFMFKPWEHPESGYVTVCPHTIEFEVPDDFNPIPGQVAILEAKAKELKAKFAKDMMEIEDSISKLTCISMESA